MSKIIPTLLVGIVLSACAGLPASTPLAEPLGTPTSSSNAACNTPSNWTIQYNRSGGFAGFNQSLILYSDGNLIIQSERPPVDEQKTISEDQVKAITGLLVNACPFEVDSGKGVCADCFIYALTIQMDSQTYVIEASDVTLAEELHPLINDLSQFLQETEQ